MTIGIGPDDDQPIRRASGAGAAPRARAAAPRSCAAMSARKNTSTASERADVARDVEGAARTPSASQPKNARAENQVRGARNRQELGEALHDAEQRRGDEVHADRARAG